MSRYGARIAGHAESSMNVMDRVTRALKDVAFAWLYVAAKAITARD